MESVRVVATRQRVVSIFDLICPGIFPQIHDLVIICRLTQSRQEFFQFLFFIAHRPPTTIRWTGVGGCSLRRQPLTDLLARLHMFSAKSILPVFATYEPG